MEKSSYEKYYEQYDNKKVLISRNQHLQISWNTINKSNNVNNQIKGKIQAE